MKKARPSIGRCLVLAFLAMPPVPSAGASEAERAESGKRSPGISLADVGKLTCKQLNELAPVFGNSLRRVLKLQAKMQDRKYADRAQLEVFAREMKREESEAEVEALEVAGKVLGSVKKAKEYLHVSHVGLNEVIRIDLAVETAEQAMAAAKGTSAKLKVLKGLKGFAEIAAIASNPYLILGIFAVDIGLEITEALLDSNREARDYLDWNRESRALTARLLDAQREAANFYSAIIVQLQSKKCETMVYSPARCFGEACRASVISASDQSVRDHGHWYDSLFGNYDKKHICRQWGKPDFHAEVRDNCAAEVRSLIDTSGHGRDARGYPQFGVTRKLLEANILPIRESCWDEICRACAKANKASGDYCDKAKARRIAAKKSREEYEARGRAADEEERENRLTHDRSLVNDPKFTAAIKPPFQAPAEVKIHCECLARCTSPGSALGYLSYKHSPNPLVVRDCKKGFARYEFLTEEKFCAAGETAKPVACQWTRSDEPRRAFRSFARPEEPLGGPESPNYLARCEWPKNGEPEPIADGTAIPTYLSVERMAYSGSVELNRVFRIMAACKMGNTKVSFCFPTRGSSDWLVVEGFGGGFKNECWNNDGNVEQRSEFNGKLSRIVADKRVSRGDKGANNPFRNLGTESEIADAGRGRAH